MSLPAWIYLIADSDDPLLQEITTALESKRLGFRLVTPASEARRYLAEHGFRRGNDAGILYLPSANPHVAFLAGVAYGAREFDYGSNSTFALYLSGHPGLTVPQVLQRNGVPVFQMASEVIRWYRMLQIGLWEEGALADDNCILPSGCVGSCELFVQAEPLPNPPASMQWETSASGEWLVTEASDGWTPDRDSLPSNPPLLVITAFLFFGNCAEDIAQLTGDVRYFSNGAPLGQPLEEKAGFGSIPDRQVQEMGAAEWLKIVRGMGQE